MLYQGWKIILPFARTFKVAVCGGALLAVPSLGLSQEGIYHDPYNSGPTAAFVVIWQIGPNQGQYFHKTTITPLYDHLRLVNSPALAGAAGDNVLRYNCPAINPFVLGTHPLNGATFLPGGFNETTNLSYEWPTANKHQNLGGGVVSAGYYNLKFEKVAHSNGATVTTFQFNAWITGGQWHTNPPERTPTNQGNYQDPVVVSGQSRIVVRVLVAGQETTVNAQVTGAAQGGGPTPLNLAPMPVGSYTVVVRGNLSNGALIHNEHEFDILFPQMRSILFYFDAQGNPVGVGGSGGGTGGGGGPPGDPTWWEALFTSLFVPDQEDLEEFQATWNEFWDWGPFDLFQDIKAQWDTVSTTINTGVWWFGANADGMPSVLLPNGVYAGDGTFVGDPNQIRYLDWTGGTLGDGTDNTDGSGNLWLDYLRPSMGWLVYAGFAFAMLSKFMPRHNL